METTEVIPAATPVVNEIKVCTCCKRPLPITSFRKNGRGYLPVCIECDRKNKGISDKFKDFTARELIEELRCRGYKGILNYTKVETIKL